MSEWLDRLVRESRSELGTKESRDRDWAEIDRALFRRIEAEQRAERAGVMLGEDDEPPEPRVRRARDLRGRAY